jgi:hypothetical protein
MPHDGTDRHTALYISLIKWVHSKFLLKELLCYISGVVQREFEFVAALFYLENDFFEGIKEELMSQCTAVVQVFR